MKYLEHYKAGIGFLPSFILSLIAIILAIFDNELWMVTLLISILFQFLGISVAKNYYYQLENN